MDNDGYTELGIGTNVVHILQWDGSDYAQEATLPTHGELCVVAIGDCDNDGENEVNAANVEGTPYKEWIYKYLADNQPMCNITFPSNGSTVNGTIIINGTASDLDDDLESVFVRIDDGEWMETMMSKGSKGNEGSKAIKCNWSYEWNTSQVEDGHHMIYAGSYDGQRYSVIASIEITVMNVASYTFTLRSGWNLITIPVENNYTAETLGQVIGDPSICDTVTMWNASRQKYVGHLVGTPISNFDIKNGIGYFIHVAEETNFTVTGIPITNVSVAIYPGWNIIGWYHDYTTKAESLGTNITTCDTVIMWNALRQKYIGHPVGTPVSNFDIMMGMGIFVHVTEESTWHGEG
jgi:hypothetical protein